MKKTFWILVFLSMLLPACAQFRDTIWGMSRAQVIGIEGEENLYVNESDVVIYNCSIAGLKAFAGYLFVDDKLAVGKYLFNETRADNNTYLEDFMKLSKLLISIYGEPVDADSEWSNSLYEDDEEYYGLAISLGHLSLWIKWETETTVIFQSLYGQDYEIKHIIEYNSKEYAEAYQEEKLRKDQQGL
ncbi:hypothetical protein B4O97_16245 [Marispirochaeta aestuarii]|uniref:Lipoprotein n=1 Tax=Marispirochaeta aestuarii TaxID=1963862 RepID=A0A1Y1RVF0_9SPIO|nr:hypothetical protein [Marispirochaeta aestuarii]ORC32613.1 hypothetical protein B4O97_16245 [Marispirochaeta aestuarii]